MSLSAHLLLRRTFFLFSASCLCCSRTLTCAFRNGSASRSLFGLMKTFPATADIFSTPWCTSSWEPSPLTRGFWRSRTGTIRGSAGWGTTRGAWRNSRGHPRRWSLRPILEGSCTSKWCLTVCFPYSWSDTSFLSRRWLFSRPLQACPASLLRWTTGWFKFSRLFTTRSKFAGLFSAHSVTAARNVKSWFSAKTSRWFLGDHCFALFWLPSTRERSHCLCHAFGSRQLFSEFHICSARS